MRLSNNSVTYLPGFDALHIETYFLNDHKVIADIFSMSSKEIPDDLDAVHSAFEANDLLLLKEAVHKIKPIFNIVGLLALEKDVRQFYNLCLMAVSFEEIREEYQRLWPKLVHARSMISEQAMLFQRAE